MIFPNLAIFTSTLKTKHLHFLCILLLITYPCDVIMTLPLRASSINSINKIMNRYKRYKLDIEMVFDDVDVMMVNIWWWSNWWNVCYLFVGGNMLSFKRRYKFNSVKSLIFFLLLTDDEDLWKKLTKFAKYLLEVI